MSHSGFIPFAMKTSSEKEMLERCERFYREMSSRRSVRRFCNGIVLSR